MDYAKRHRLRHGDKNRRHFGDGWSVQDGVQAGRDWKKSEDQEIGRCQTLTDDDVARLSHTLRRPPSEIRTRHTYLLQQQLRERREAAIRISDRLNQLRQKRS